jgi:hypothetical protein
MARWIRLVGLDEQHAKLGASAIYAAGAIKCLGNVWWDNCPGKQPLDYPAGYRCYLVEDRSSATASLRRVLVGHQSQHLVVVDIGDKDRDGVEPLLLGCFKARMTEPNLDFAITATPLQAREKFMVLDI